MTDEEELDRRIGALMRSERPADEQAFVAQVTQRLLADERLARARRAAWLRFASEALATAAVLCAFVLLGRLTPIGGGDLLPLLSPATAAILLVAFWFLVELRPAAEGK